MEFTWVLRSAAELPNASTVQPLPDLRGPLWEDTTRPVRGFLPGYTDPVTGEPIGLEQGTIHLSQRSGTRPRMINWDRTLIIPPGQEFTFPAGLPDFFSCAVFDLMGVELVRTWLPAAGRPEELIDGRRAMRFNGRSAIYQSRFPDDLPDKVRVVDEINPEFGNGRLVLYLGTNDQDLAVIPDPEMFTLLGSPLIPAVPSR